MFQNHEVLFVTKLNDDKITWLQLVIYVWKCTNKIDIHILKRKECDCFTTTGGREGNQLDSTSLLSDNKAASKDTIINF